MAERTIRDIIRWKPNDITISTYKLNGRYSMVCIDCEDVEVFRDLTKDFLDSCVSYTFRNRIPVNAGMLKPTSWAMMVRTRDVDYWVEELSWVMMG